MSHIKGESLKIIFIVLVGFSCFSFADMTSKFLTAYYSPSFIVAFNALFIIPFICAWILCQKGWKGFLSPNWKWLIARSVCIGIVSTTIVNAFKHAPIADVYGLTFSAPFISVCMAYLFLKESVGWHRWLAVTLGFIGVIILVGPQYDSLSIGIIYAAIAAIAIATGTIVVRKIGDAEYLPLFILYPFIGMAALNTPIAFNDFHIPDIEFLWKFIMNALFVLGGVLFTTFGIANAKSTASVAPFVYVQLIWGVIFGYFIFNDLPTLPTIAGLTLIIGAGLFMIYRERQLGKDAK